VEEASKNGCAIGLVGTHGSFVRKKTEPDLSQQILVPESAQLELGGKSVGELNDARVEEGETPFDGMGHGNTIALRRKQVTTQEGDDLQILRSAEQVPPPEVFRKLHGIKDGSSLSMYLIGEVV